MSQANFIAINRIIQQLQLTPQPSPQDITQQLIPAQNALEILQQAHFELLHICDGLDVLLELMAQTQQKPYPQLHALLNPIHQHIVQNIAKIGTTF